MRTLVVQSHRSEGEPPWIAACLRSVRDWAGRSAFAYRFVDDTIFDRVPGWYREKLTGRTPIVTDLGRLYLLQEALREGYQRAVWLDADVLVFDPSLDIGCEGDCAFGQEVWIQTGGDGKLKARRNVHNAVCVFRQGSPTLPFLIQSVESMIRRVDQDHIAPQMVGPKLLSALHGIVGFALLPQVGAFSPAVVRDLCVGGGPALDLLRHHTRGTLKAANLCASLIDDASAERLLAALRQP